MQKLVNFVLFLQGKKTHIVAFVMLVLNLLVGLNVISPNHLAQINVVLGALGLSALRAGMNKS